MHLFEQFECKLYQRIISFEFLSTDCCSFKCALNMLFKELEEGVSVECCEKISIIQKLQDRHSSCSLECNKEAEENRLDVYQEEVKLYQKLLEVISTQTQVQVDTTVLEQILKSKENHFSYLHENLTRLVKLLLQIVLPYSIFSQSRDGSTVYTIKMVAGLSSSALSAFDEWISRNKPTKTLQSGDEIRLCADAVLYADSDVYHHGVSVVCIALKLICKKVSQTTSEVLNKTASSVYLEGTRQCITINTEGKCIEFSDRPIKARPGEDGTETAKDGKPGVDGENGQYGNAGGHVLLVASNICISDFNLLASGSPGGDGQNGGDGGAGWTPTVKGIDGNNAPEFEAGRLQTNSSVVISFGTRGVDSGHGGDAGMGGAAGKSGVSGKIEILDIDNEWNCHVTQNQVKDSKPGQPGDPGKGGKHTRHGMDYGRYGKSLLFWARVVTLVTSTRPTDSIDNYSGELCHDEILYDRSIPHPNVEQYEKPARDKIPMQVKKNDHPDFVNRGCNRDGETAKIKVNNSLANENKAVDKQACFYAFHEQCRQSLQHWNCKSHNRFLGAFARKVGEIHDTEFMSITRSEANRSKCVIWMSQFHKLSENMKVSVTCEAKQSTKVQISLMKDYTNEVTYSTYPSADNYLGSESIETESLSVNVSSLKQRAEHKNIHLENYLLESLLTDDCFDDEIEKLQATLNLSEEIIYFVRCDTTADTVNTRFLITQNLQTNTWIFCHPSGTHKMTVNSSLEVLTMEKNQLTPLNRDTMISYEEIVNWICGNIDEDIELPATTEQLLCLKQLKLIILIRKSYKNVCDNCSTEEIDLVQKMYAVCLDTLVGSKSLSALLRMQDFLNSEGLLLTVFDLNWIKSMLPLTYEDETAINAFFDAVGNYNREQHLDLLLHVMVTFQDCHIEMLKTPDYLDYLAKHEFKLFLQSFEESLIHAFHFLCGKFNLVTRFQHIIVISTTKSETILQKFAIKGRTKNQTHGHLKAYIETMLHKKQSMTYTTAVEHMLSSIIETVAKLLGIVLTTQEQSLATEKINLSFPEAYTAFCAFPSLKAVLPALIAISGKLSGDFAKNFQEMLSFTYSEVSDVLGEFHELMYVDDFKSLMSKIGLETVDFIKALRQPSINIAKPQMEALIHILNYILKITLKPNPYRSSAQDPSKLLISVTKFLEGMYSYYNSIFHILSNDEDRQSKIESRNQFIKSHISKIAEFHETFLAYPMSCPLMALIKWKEFIDFKLLEKLELKLKLFKNTSENDVLENLSELKIELRKFNNFLVLVIDSRNNFEVFKSCKDLQMYSLLYKADTDKLPVVLTTDIMGLKKLNGECMQTIVTHFGQCFLSSSQFQLSVEMERLEPNYEFLISSEEPLANIKPYTLILVINGAKWKLYYSSDCSSCHWRDVELSEIEQIKEVLDSKLDPFVMKNGQFSLTKEQKAYLVSMFKFDSEYSVSYRVHFGSQLLLSKTQACSLSMLSIDIKTCAVKISDVTVLEDDDSFGQSILVVLCNSTSSEALKHLRRATYLEISEDQFTNEIEGTAGVFVVKYPDQPAIVKTVTKCGEKEVLKHHYSVSLYRDDLSLRSLLSYSSDECTYRLLLNDSSERNDDVTLLYVLQPISELLNFYQELYDTFLPTQILNNSLKSAVQLCPTVCCRQNIINFVQHVRRGFVQECVNLLIDGSDHKNVRTMHEAMKACFSHTVVQC
ncbi:uncharacterized protein LOC135345779 isoform X1 [Halichondria panicea]|uniref:uncharacterized protein LOC135345779 isoform X1 n=1 Tax=Halichondria panicea TaxID=6063 RepID=UPI00312BB30B